MEVPNMAVNLILIGKRIKDIRRRRGLSQQTLAEKADCSPTYISYIENGYKAMSLNTFIYIANALNATADELLADNLDNILKFQNHQFAILLSDCSEYERTVLYDIVSAAKQSLRDNQYKLRHR